MEAAAGSGRAGGGVCDRAEGWGEREGCKSMPLTGMPAVMSLLRELGHGLRQLLLLRLQPPLRLLAFLHHSPRLARPTALRLQLQLEVVQPALSLSEAQLVLQRVLQLLGVLLLHLRQLPFVQSACRGQRLLQLGPAQRLQTRSGRRRRCADGLMLLLLQRRLQPLPELSLLQSRLMQAGQCCMQLVLQGGRVELSLRLTAKERKASSDEGGGGGRGGAVAVDSFTERCLHGVSVIAVSRLQQRVESGEEGRGGCNDRSGCGS